ncbi:MAG: hypothetical protein ISP45_11025 [Reyranella sp.]|nr:hypothetical protein [Reyranella sp.]
MTVKKMKAKARRIARDASTAELQGTARWVHIWAQPEAALRHFEHPDSEIDGLSSGGIPIVLDLDIAWSRVVSLEQGPRLLDCGREAELGDVQRTQTATKGVDE